jgi:hypothetical protein
MNDKREWIRTIILILLLGIGIAFLLWARHAADTSLLEGIGR